jgi:hypothetical protein
MIEEEDGRRGRGHVDVSMVSFLSPCLRAAKT